MSEKPPTQGRKLPGLSMPEELDPIYANLVRITHSPSELVMDFARMLPGHKPAEVLSRILLSPLSAKLFYRALGENLTKYESKFGEINIPGDSSLAEHLFKPQKPDDGNQDG